FVSRAAIFICPMRVGGGTRLKILDALAMGRVLVSTAVGVEGIPVVDGEHTCAPRRRTSSWPRWPAPSGTRRCGTASRARGARWWSASSAGRTSGTGCTRSTARQQTGIRPPGR
ncbi:MAG: glycosyltransferase family 4 protein, partial [Gemmatimonadetes bacterium]|nr:glycosyltransferase family 4 protein [Gemmatimonadota bacterium]